MAQKTLYYLFFILTYTGLYFITSMYLMNYEDFWDDSKGEIWTFASMNFDEKIAYILWYVPTFPLGLIFGKGIISLIMTCLANPIIIGYSLLKIFDKRKKKVMSYAIVINGILIVLIGALGTYLSG